MRYTNSLYLTLLYLLFRSEVDSNMYVFVTLIFLMGVIKYRVHALSVLTVFSLPVNVVQT